VAEHRQPRVPAKARCCVHNLTHPRCTLPTAHGPRPAARCPLPAAGCATGRLRTLTNNSGGIQGGITNGEAITFRIAFKPPATIGKEQATATCVSATRQHVSKPPSRALDSRGGGVVAPTP